MAKIEALAKAMSSLSGLLYDKNNNSVLIDATNKLDTKTPATVYLGVSDNPIVMLHMEIGWDNNDFIIKHTFKEYER